MMGGMDTELLTVGAMRRQFADLPDDAPVLVQACFKDRRSFRQPVVGAEIQAHPETEQPCAALLVDWSMPDPTA